MVAVVGRRFLAESQILESAVFLAVAQDKVTLTIQTNRLVAVAVALSATAAMVPTPQPAPVVQESLRSYSALPSVAVAVVPSVI